MTDLIKVVYGHPPIHSEEPLTKESIVRLLNTTLKPYGLRITRCKAGNIYPVGSKGRALVAYVTSLREKGYSWKEVFESYNNNNQFKPAPNLNTLQANFYQIRRRIKLADRLIDKST